MPLVLPLLPRIAWTGLIDLKGAETFTLKYHINSPCPCSILSYLAVYISVFFSFIKKKKKKNRYTSVLGNKDRNRQGFRNMLSRALSLLNTTVTTKWKRSNQWPSPSWLKCNFSYSAPVIMSMMNESEQIDILWCFPVFLSVSQHWDCKSQRIRYPFAPKSRGAKPVGPS